jgi:hypothetical protein
MILSTNSYDYADSFSAALERTDTEPEELVVAFFNSMPSWVDRLMGLRNWLVSFLGLKVGTVDLSSIHPPFSEGQQVGIFKIVRMTQDEVVLGETDKHLDFTTSLGIERGEMDKLVISTVVKTHNLFGRVYLFVVTPVHRLIVRVQIKRMAKQLVEIHRSG